MIDMNVIHVHGLQRRNDKAALVFDREIMSDEDTNDEYSEIDESAALIATTIYDYTPSEVFWKTLQHMCRLEEMRLGKMAQQFNAISDVDDE